MSRIIGILNYKGGTGKTTTVVNLAAGLALRGARVLCIDLDAQGNLATYLGTPYTRSLACLLTGEAGLAECIIPARKNLDIIASDAGLLQAEGYLWRMNDLQAARHRLVQSMQGANGQGLANSYDYVILDYSPSATLLSEGGLLYTDELIVPVSMNYLSLIGARQVIQTLKTVGRLPEHRLHLSLVVPTFYNEHLRKDREVMDALQRYFVGQVADPIRSNVKLAEAPGHQKSIYEYAPRSPGAIDYAKLVERIAAHG